MDWKAVKQTGRLVIAYRQTDRRAEIAGLGWKKYMLNNNNLQDSQIAELQANTSYRIIRQHDILAWYE